MIRVKICGVTRLEDARRAAEAGVDAIGLVFAPSPRQVKLSRAREIVAALPPFVSVVGVFVNMKPDAIVRVSDRVGLSAIQLHGEESLSIVMKLRPYPVIKAIRVRDLSFIRDMARWGEAGVSAILLDAYDPHHRGGTGVVLDWQWIRQARQLDALDPAVPMILAGGLNAENVREAIRIARPWGVDVSGGVESSPGIKSANRMIRFVRNARKKI